MELLQGMRSPIVLEIRTPAQPMIYMLNMLMPMFEYIFNLSNEHVALFHLALAQDASIKWAFNANS
jgi:hypothetical protein